MPHLAQFALRVWCVCITDKTAPVIVVEQFVNSATSAKLAKPGSLLLLQFTAKDANVLQNNSPMVTIDGNSSVIQTGNEILTTGGVLDRSYKRFIFQFTVPSNPTHGSTIGYTISFTDSAGNVATRNAAVGDLLVVGTNWLHTIYV